MRFAQNTLPLWLFFAVSMTFAQKPVKTDAVQDGFAGPVKSVTTEVVRSDVQWQQPGGPTVLFTVSCMTCEYDPDGFQTKSGQIVDGKFVGTFVQLVRDANGQLTDHYSFSSAEHSFTHHEVMGPFGKTEDTTYLDGKPYMHQTYSYDQYGNLSDWKSFNSAGKQVDRSLTNTDADGTLREHSVWGEDGRLSYQQTFDPATQIEHFTTYDEFGRVKLTWTVSAGHLTSFWEMPDAETQFGDDFSEPQDSGDSENYKCHNDGHCDVSRVHYEYLNGNHRIPLSVEWKDSADNLQWAAYYNYEMDSFDNWTSRKVWVWSSSLGKRALYETDSRTIAYWEK